MAVGEARGTPGASRPREAEEPMYEGTAGRTRLRSLHVPLPDGFVRTVQVYDVVNVATDPHLRDPAMSGALHRFDGGEQLAVPFIFHDPRARKLALVVPELLRHEELRLRAELYGELARDTAHAIPSYVREATTVVGTAGLASYLERAPSAALGELAERDAEAKQREAMLAQRETAVMAREAELARREQEIAKRDAHVAQRTTELEAQLEALSQRESRLSARAEEVTRREDELRALSEEIEAAQADVAMREQELESRFETLSQREAELAERAPSGSHRVRADEVVQLVDDEVDAIQDVEELEPLATSPGELRPDELRDAVQLVDDSARRTETMPPTSLVEATLRPRLGGLADEVQEVDDELVEDEEVEEVEELDDVEPIGEVTGIHADLRAEDTDLRRRDEPRPRTEPPPPPSPIALPASDPPPSPSVAPPPGFLERRGGAPVVAVAESGGVQLFARLPEGRDDLLDADAPPDLLAQLVVVEEHPVVLLSLVDEKDGRPHVLRAALDARARDDREILENLRRHFAAEVIVYSGSGRYLRSLEVSAPREVNVARILERVGRMRAAAAVDASTAIERVLSAPPPVRAKDHPFVEGGESTKSAGETADALDRLAEWSTHEKLDHALLVLSIPRDLVDGTVRRVLERAIEHGLALPGRLSERAISLGVVADVETLVARQVAAFAKVSARDDRGGLSPERVAENWECLLENAAANEVAIETDTHELAWTAIRAVRGGGSGAAVDAAKLPEMGVPELVMLLEHPRHRRDAALELCKRKDTALAEGLCKSVRKMPRAEVVRVVPRIADLGEEAGDAIIDGLDARKTFVRQAFALALGHLKLRRAIVPLVHLLAAEESEVWREVARVVGSFGTASLRNVTRQLRDPKGQEERYVWTLAYLANNGCAKQVQQLTTEERGAVVTIASEALTLRERARAVDEQVRGLAPLASEDAILKFSRRFYQELEGKAPADDLEDPAGSGT